MRGLGGHISAICRTQERSPIIGWRCSWKPVLTFYQRASPALRDALGRTPLGPFLTIPRIQSDRRLVAALCERWFGETNTFHFPCCELAITPLDFVMLTGIPIAGEVIPPLSVIPMDRAAALMGVSLETMTADSGWEAGKVKLSWLASILEATTISVINLNSLAFTSVLRVFLLFILGSCFFMTDRSCVETSFLPLMDPIDRFDTFDWEELFMLAYWQDFTEFPVGEVDRSASFITSSRYPSFPFSHFPLALLLFLPLTLCSSQMRAHEYLDPFCLSLKVPDVTSFPRSSRWSAPSSKVDSHLLDKAREELDRLTLRRVTLQPFSDFDDMIQLHCRGVRRFMGRRVAFLYFGVCEYFLGERVLHQSDGEFRIPLAPPLEMTLALACDTFMEGMRTAGVPIHHLRPLLAILEEDNRALIEENAHLRGRCATFEDPSVTFAVIPPYQCRPRPDVSFDFDADLAQDDDED
ncbi:hypothetical protein HHK36_018162 [Tetracentron sinense]|uniref:Aminotransferase-like plant mobile domain-containing protein n=1 Tax=Tetracentron sinense TaxID=13715 RepID=A0A835DAK3_TETSI|nr:hypothetical protein HHK36_018162 [Tetracentron sinense]